MKHLKFTPVTGWMVWKTLRACMAAVVLLEEIDTCRQKNFLFSPLSFKILKTPLGNSFGFNFVREVIDYLAPLKRNNQESTSQTDFPPTSLYRKLIDGRFSMPSLFGVRHMYVHNHRTCLIAELNRHTKSQELVAAWDGSRLWESRYPCWTAKAFPAALQEKPCRTMSKCEAKKICCWVFGRSHPEMTHPLGPWWILGEELPNHLTTSQDLTL